MKVQGCYRWPYNLGLWSNMKMEKYMEIHTTGINSKHLLRSLTHLSNTSCIFSSHFEFIDEARANVCDSPLVS